MTKFDKKYNIIKEMYNKRYDDESMAYDTRDVHMNFIFKYLNSKDGMDDLSVICNHIFGGVVGKYFAHSISDKDTSDKFDGAYEFIFTALDKDGNDFSDLDFIKSEFLKVHKNGTVRGFGKVSKHFNDMLEGSYRGNTTDYKWYVENNAEVQFNNEHGAIEARVTINYKY